MSLSHGRLLWWSFDASMLAQLPSRGVHPITYTRNQEQMAANRARHNGVPHGGPALLGGIIRCGQCGRRMSVGYHNNGHEARYLCWQLATTFGEPRCQSVSAQPVDGFVGLPPEEWRVR